MSFHLNTLKSTEMKDGSKVIKYQVYKKNKKPFTAQELQTLSAMILKKAPTSSNLQIKGHADFLPDNAPVTLQGLNPERWRTIKSFGKDISIQDEEDYYDGKARDTSKFNQYYQAIITLLRPAI